MKKLLYPVFFVALLTSCAPDLIVNRVDVNSWTETDKRVTARVKNQCYLFNFCDPASNFFVYFNGDELPRSTNFIPQVRLAVPYLGNGDSIDLVADFTPLARPENNYLWNIHQITVMVDPKSMVDERNESNNVNRRKLVFSSELPIMSIDTLGIAVPDEPKIPAELDIIFNYAGGRNFINTPANDYDGRVGIETRGQLTASFCKKQYGLETWDQFNNDIDVSLMQFPAEEDWVLYGPYSDKSLLRNVLVYGIASAMGRYAPRTRLTEVFINDPNLGQGSCPPAATDNYAGVYVFTEKIKRDFGRVNITKLRSWQNSEPDISGGYILKKDWIDPDDVYFDTDPATGYGTRLTIVDPRCKAPPGTCNATQQQKDWIENYINSFETALRGPNFADPALGYAQYIDVDSFVDYYLIQELFKNSDGFRGSNYMYKDRNAKLVMGPVWDFNFSMGNVGFPSARPPEGWLLGSVGGQMLWWPRLLEDPIFAQKVIDRWQALKIGVFSVSYLHQFIDGKVYKLRAAHARNFNRWPILGTYIVGNPQPVDPNETYQDAVDYMKSWLQQRWTWIDNNINNLIAP